MKIKAPDGTVIDADEIKIINSNEQWNLYTLEDGTVIRVKPVVVKIVKARDFYLEDGSPLYQVEHKNVVGAVVPDSLKRFEKPVKKGDGKIAQ